MLDDYKVTIPYKSTIRHMITLYKPSNRKYSIFHHSIFNVCLCVLRFVGAITTTIFGTWRGGGGINSLASWCFCGCVWNGCIQCITRLTVCISMEKLIQNYETKHIHRRRRREKKRLFQIRSNNVCHVKNEGIFFALAIKQKKKQAKNEEIIIIKGPFPKQPKQKK